VAMGVTTDRGSEGQIGIPMVEGTKPPTVRDDVTACVHHWVLSDPEAGAVSGRCKRCGGERVFTARAGASEQADDDANEALPAQPERVESEVERLTG